MLPVTEIAWLSVGSKEARHSGLVVKDAYLVDGVHLGVLLLILVAAFVLKEVLVLQF